MQIINEEDDMTISELAKKVMTWARAHGQPFTSSEAYEDMQDIDDVKEVSDALGKLYRAGSLARKRIDKVRFSYALAGNAPEGYEVVSSVSKAQASTPLKAADKTIAPLDETPARKTETKDTEKPAPKTADVKVDQFIVSEIGKIGIPENFILSLKTPGGLVITIKTGIL